MRIAIALIGMMVMFAVAVGVLFIGILGYVPVSTCGGMCLAPLMMTTVGTVVIGLAATFATWFRALREPRAQWPFAGAALMIGFYVLSLLVADQVL